MNTHDQVSLLRMARALIDAINRCRCRLDPKALQCPCIDCVEALWLLEDGIQAIDRHAPQTPRDFDVRLIRPRRSHRPFQS